MDFVPFKKLEPQRLEQNLKIMEEGNGLLKKWSIHFLGNRKLRLFRERLFKGEFVRDIPPSELVSIMRVKDIRWEMLCAFSPLIAMRARVWSARVDGDKASLFEVLYQEGNLAFDDAMFGYLGIAKKAKFITYLWRVIDRRLKREIDNESMQLIPPSADGARELLKQYKMYRESCGKHITFDEYSSMVGLDEEEQLILSKALLSVVNSTDLSQCLAVHTSSHDRRSADIDYTALNANIEEDMVGKEVLLKELKHALAKCIKIADLTSFQKDLLEAMMVSGETGWKAEVARKYGLSRTRAGQVFERACEKIRLVYESMRDE